MERAKPMEGWGRVAVGAVIGALAIWVWGDQLRAELKGSSASIDGRTDIERPEEAPAEFYIAEVVADAKGQGVWLFGMWGEVRYCFAPQDPSTAPACTPVSAVAKMTVTTDSREGE